MNIHIAALDHVVLNVADVDASLHFYGDALGLPVERLAEFRAGTVKFPSLRLSPVTILDLFPPAMHATGAKPGVNMNHLAFDIDATPPQIEAFLRERKIELLGQDGDNNFGARGNAYCFYVRDPDGNLVELRTYTF